VSAKGRLARRISSIASFSAGTSADMAFMAARARASGKVESGALTGAGLHGSLGLEKGDLPYIGPAYEGECGSPLTAREPSSISGGRLKPPGERGFCYHPSPRGLDCNFCPFCHLTQINARRCQTVPLFQNG
jgi:hypothetical protein